MAAFSALLAALVVGHEFVSDEAQNSPASTQMRGGALAKQLEVHFIDVEHGDSILLRCEGQDMLIDGGHYKQGNTVARYLRDSHVSHLQHLVCTHEHYDHVGGLLKVLPLVTMNKVYAPVKRAPDHPWFNSFAQSVEERGLDIEIPEFGSVMRLGSAQLKVVGPINYDTPPNHVENNHSIVLRVTYGKNSMLLTADSEEYAHKAMLESGVELASDVVKVAHHGIRQNKPGDKAFYKAVAPKYAVLSGANNTARKSQPIEQSLRDSGVDLWLTRESGNVVFTSDGNSWKVKGSKKLLGD